MEQEPWTGLPGAIERLGPVDRVELKVLLDADSADVMSALGVRPRSVRRRWVYYLDNPDGTLRDLGIIIRVRLTQHRKAELVTKLRRADPCALPVSRLPHLALELDALPHRTQWCAAVRRPLKLGSFADGTGRLDTLSAEQRLFLTHLTPDATAFEQLSPHGSASVLRVCGAAAGLPKLTVEDWRFPNGDQVVELSLKCAPRQAPRSAARLRRFLRMSRLRTHRSQRTKTELCCSVPSLSPERAGSRTTWHRR
ncbi:hypothetical protein [Pseudonocardia spinosispora]|uniref:hypothetical protein n=1 Tax=Pseudonocardia spinosispora TaxID=103441 RepID=UPI00040E85D4|nr:hypothetical protein [Pseudonocardia spinosispora]